MAEILLVEDNNMLASLIKKKIRSELRFEVKIAPTYADAAKILEDDAHEFFVAVLDLVLPDAPNGEIVDLVLSKHIPSIVLTGQVDADMQEKIWSKMVIDYVLKGSSHNIDYVVSLIRRIHRNNTIKVMVVDNSAVSRQHTSDLLKVHQFQVFDAPDGNEALRILKEHPDIKLVITDFNMPRMDGFQLTKKIRRLYTKDELAIIGVSTWGSNTLSAHFIKHGANDFFNKPFLAEELYCRVTQNIEMLENIQALRETLNEDYLTHLYNRRFFFEAGRKLFANAKRGDLTLTIAMIDIDFFKNINDTYGHDVGDEVLRQEADVLRRRFRSSDIVCRFGGEEFCILASNVDPAYTFKIFDDLRQKIEALAFDAGERQIHLTVSIGVTHALMRSLEEMISQSDARLYEAKAGGRNKVVVSG